MRTTLIASTFTLLCTTLAIPSPVQPYATTTTAAFTPATSSTVTCDTTDKVISFYVGPQMGTVLNNACAAMMPPCAYPDRLGPDTVCTETQNFKLDGPKTTTQNANVENASNGNKLPGWAVKFSVTPANATVASPQGVLWTKTDCYGYFEYIISQQEPKGCLNSMGSGIGCLKVGGSDSLKDTVFDVEIVRAG